MWDFSTRNHALKNAAIVHGGFLKCHTWMLTLHQSTCMWRSLCVHIVASGSQTAATLENMSSHTVVSCFFVHFLCLHCFLYMCSHCFLYMCPHCFLYICPYCFLYMCPYCFLYMCPHFFLYMCPYFSCTLCPHCFPVYMYTIFLSIPTYFTHFINLLHNLSHPVALFAVTFFHGFSDFSL